MKLKITIIIIALVMVISGILLGWSVGIKGPAVQSPDSRERNSFENLTENILNPLITNTQVKPKSPAHP
jgi:hypothetical protein